MAAPAVLAPAALPWWSAWWQGAGPEVQAALIGNAGIAAAALLTVVGTAMFATRQYRRERIEKAKDRALAVKNELLFQSVKGASQGLAAFAALVDLDKPLGEILREYQAGLSTITTAGAVADIETVSQGRDFLNAIGRAFMERVVARRPLDVMHAEIAHIQSNMDSQVVENHAIFHIQRDALAGGCDEARGSMINRMFQAGRDVFDEFAQERETAIALIGPARRDYALETMAVHTRVAPMLQQYIASVRKDIGIDGDDRAPFLSASYIDPKEPLRKLEEALTK